MKSLETVERRLRTLRVRYIKQHISASQERLPKNCVFNYEQIPTGYYEKSRSIDVDIAPRSSVTLVVIQPEAPLRLCMYGAEDPSKWLGDVCDKAETARGCGWFKPKTSVDEAKDEFVSLLADDEYTYDNYRDVATLQWVLNDRVHKKALSMWERLVIWIYSFFIRVRPPVPQLPEGEIPDDLWSDDDTSSNSGP